MQPLGELAELACLEALVQVGMLGRDLLPELAADDVAERVRGEVADRADRPMHVLKHAEPVVRRLDAEVLAHALVPHRGQVLELDRPCDQLLLELEAEDDVQVVRRLVGLDANQRRLDPVDRAVPVLELDIAQGLRKVLAQLRIEEAPERQAAADEVLPHAALRLMEPERRTAGEDRALKLARDTVLVQPVPALVHRPEQAVQVVLEVTRRQPDVGRAHRHGEGMDGRVEPPLVAVEAEPFDHLQLELLLPVDRERPSARGTLALAADRRDERHLRLLQPREHLSHLGRLHARLEVVEQHVVRLVVAFDAVEALDVAPA